MSRKVVIARWLAGKLRTMTGLLLLGAAGQFLVGLVMVFVTFWIVYAIVWLGFDWLVPVTHWTRMWISLVIVVLLFVGNATTDRAYLESYSFTTGTFNDKPVSISIPGLGTASTINPLAPDSAHSIVKMITSVLFAGPRQVTGGCRLLGRSLRLRNLDQKGCAAVLAFLAAQDGRVPFQEVAAAIPSGHNVDAVLEQLHELDGVMFLRSEPPGLTLLSDFRKELRSL